MDVFKGDFYFFNTSANDYTEDSHLQSLPRLELQQDNSHLVSDEYKHKAINRREPLDLELALNPSGLFGGLTTAFPDVDPFETHLFDFYINRLCPDLSISSAQNPYLQFIAPLSLSSSSLYHSVLSWSAHELSMRNPAQQTYNQLSVKHKGQALRALRKEIQSTQHNGMYAPSAICSILATMIVLSCQEIVETCSSAWIAHLKAARMMCSIVWPGQDGATDNFRRFCVMWFVSHEIMSRTAWVQDTLFEPSEWFAGDDETEIDVMIGCSRGLIHQVSEIGTLIMDIRKGTFTAQHSKVFKERRDRIEIALHRLGQRISTSEGSTAPGLLDIAESKRLCALIYLYSCIDNAKPSSPVIQSMTARVMGLITKLPPKPSLTFPLFVVGTLGVWNEDDRRCVLDKFTSMIKERPLASIVRAKDIVKAVWLDRDLGKCGRWEDLVETRGKLLSLA